MKTPLKDPYDIVTSIDEYEALKDKYQYDCLVVMNVYGGPFLIHVLNDQAKNSKRVKWVHSLLAGLDAVMGAKDFINSKLTLTNVKGAYSAVLGEYIALGMLYHAKNVESFMRKKSEANWVQEPVELISNKTMVIVGYGDVGYHCAKVAKLGFGTKVIGLKRRPEATSAEHRRVVDQVVGMN